MPIGNPGHGIRGAAILAAGGGGGGGGGDGNVDTTMYYTEGPPTRGGTTVTYDGTSHSSISDALTTLNSGDELYIDPSNSPYTERIYIPDPNNVADGITIFSDWDITYSSNGIPTVNQQGAIIDQPSGQNECMMVEHDVRNPNSGNTNVALVGSYTGALEGGNATDIEVTDSSPFSVGDQVFIQEETRPWGIPPSGGAAGAGETFQFAIVAGISGNILTLDHPLWMPFPNNNQTAVGVMNWTMEDLHVHGLKFRADGSADSNPVYLDGVYHSWFDNILCENADTHMMFHMLSMYNRFDNISFKNGNHYGLNSQAGTTRTMATKMMGDSHNRYTVRFGPSGQSTPKGYVNNIAGNNLLRTTGGVHSGGFGVDYENMSVTDTRAIVTRSWYITLDGFEVNGGHTQGPTLVCAQRPAHVTVKNGDISGLGGSGNTVWKFRLRADDDVDPDGAPRGSERLDDVTYENISIEPYENRTKADLGSFEITPNSPTSGPLTFRNITYGGEKLTKSDVTSWDGYDSSVLPDLTVE